jgi:DNA-binding helix-hairpin-helix protein with protein kinase domain
MKNDLNTKHRELTNIENQRKAELRNLENNKREILLTVHLDTFLIVRAQISGIGPKRRQALLAYGIQSALDVPNCRTVPGIGELYYAKLMNWRRQCASSFRFDPAQSIPTAEIQKIELKFTQTRRNLESELQKGLRQLQSLSTRAAADREPIESQIQMLIKNYSQAKADLDATPKT